MTTTSEDPGIHVHGDGYECTNQNWQEGSVICREHLHAWLPPELAKCACCKGERTLLPGGGYRFSRTPVFSEPYGLLDIERDLRAGP